MACKMYNGPIQSVRDALALVTATYPQDRIAKLEIEVLSVVDYNLLIPNSYARVELLHEKNPEAYSVLCFCMELLLLKDQRVLFDQAIIEQLILFLQNDE